MSDYTGAQERRNIERFDLHLLSLIRELKSREQALELYTRDISSDGAFFETDYPIPVDTRLEMVVFLPVGKAQKSRISTSGTVIRSDRGGIAVRFDPSYTISKE
jgi:hypothetical protein